MEHIDKDKERELTKDPRWWTSKHTSAWERVKSALKRDWEQTKHDIHAGGVDLDQGALDTVAQATGASAGTGKSITDEQVTTSGWDHAEHAMRFGYGASQEYADDPTWDARLEKKLQQDWADIGSGSTWDKASPHVRRGWEAGRKPNK